MSVLGTAYTICGIIFLMACVMDGQDVKPLWKKNVGNRLEKLSNYFYPIEYITRTIEVPHEPINVNYTTFKSRRIVQAYCIGESEIMMNYLRIGGDMDLARRMAVDDAKTRCLQAVKNSIIPFVSVSVRDAPAEIYVEASLYVGEDNHEYKL